MSHESNQPPADNMPMAMPAVMEYAVQQTTTSVLGKVLSQEILPYTITTDIAKARTSCDILVAKEKNDELNRRVNGNVGDVSEPKITFEVVDYRPPVNIDRPIRAMSI